MVRKYVKQVGARRYRDYTAETMNAALQAISAGEMSLKVAHKTFKIPMGTLSNKMNKKHGDKTGHPLVLTDTEELEIVKYMQTVSDWGFPFDYTDLRVCVRTMLNKQGRNVKMFQNNLPSTDWARSFLQRHSGALSHRKCQNIKSVRSSVSAVEVTKYFENLAESIKNPDGTPIPPTHLFNYDETNLSDDPGSKKCIFKRGTKYPERVMDSTKSSTSIMFCGSASGEMLPAYVVFKAEHVWSTWMEGGPKNTRYNRSKSGWFDLHCFADWFETVFVAYAKKLDGRKMIIGDNLSSHFSPSVLKLANENDIKFVCFPPNSTHLLQPLDVAFYGPLKRMWRRVLDEWKVKSSKKVKTVTKDMFPKMLTKLYAHLYPNSIEHSDNIVSGFRTCGIHPLDKDVVLRRLPDGKSAQESLVSEAVLEVLKSCRGVGDEPPQKKARRKKVSVEAGKSIAVEDIVAATTSNEDEVREANNDVESDVEEAMDTGSIESQHNENISDDDVGEIVTGTGNEDEQNVVSNVFVCAGYYYVAKFATKQTLKHYIGKVSAVSIDGDTCHMTFLRRVKRSNKFVSPTVLDEVLDHPCDQIVEALDNPKDGRRGELLFDADQLKPFDKTLN